MQPHEIKALISSSDLLEGLAPEACQAFIDVGYVRYVPSHTFVFHQQDPAAACYFMLEGKVRLAQLTPGGKQVIVQMISPGRYFGLFVALSDQFYPLSAEFVEEGSVYCWEAGVMRDLMIQFPGAALNSLSVLANRFVRQQHRLQQLATERVEQRVAHALLDLSQSLGEHNEAQDFIDIRLSHQDLAELSGTNIYSISRIFRKWERAGVIETGRQRIHLFRPDYLRLLTSGG